MRCLSATLEGRREIAEDHESYEFNTLLEKRKSPFKSPIFPMKRVPSFSG